MGSGLMGSGLMFLRPCKPLLPSYLVTVPKLVEYSKLVPKKEDGCHANQNALARSRS